MATLQEFRAMAERAIANGEAVYGRYWVDHNDLTIYCASRYLNLNAIAFDRYFQRDDPRWAIEYERAMEPRRYIEEMTVHIRRETRLERWARDHARRRPDGSLMPLPDPPKAERCEGKERR